MSRLRIALVGCGDGARRHHLPLLRRTRGAEVVAVADPDAGCRAAALRHAPGALAMEDYRDAVAHPNVDAVVLCLPSALHAAAAVATLERRKPVYVEKPLATTLADGARVLEAWRAAGVVGMIGFNYRFNPLYAAARRVVEDGRLGRIVAVRTVFTTAAGDLPAWKRRRDDGGGALLDLGSHHLDLVRWLLGESPVEVRAELRSRASEDDTALVQLRLASDVAVQSLFAFGAVDEERFEIYGDAGKLVVDRARHQHVVIEGPTRRGRRWRRLVDAARTVARAPYVLEKRLVPGHEPSHRRALARFVAAATRGTPVTP
ncbi:MAG TPA: Gfo/Idh/MocA family oxidoreductase, partial [Candidatus Binatia bacterium]|nr:Gfo/Idh/MocA family oxidoreductase [Candidatus Binatia bacterium]